MFYWPITEAWRDAPPEPKEVKRRRPIAGGYWKSQAGGINEALETFWERWSRETGKPFPKKLPQPRPQGTVSVHPPPRETRTGAERRVQSIKRRAIRG